MIADAAKAEERVPPEFSSANSTACHLIVIVITTTTTITTRNIKTRAPLQKLTTSPSSFSTHTHTQFTSQCLNFRLTSTPSRHRLVSHSLTLVAEVVVVMTYYGRREREKDGKPQTVRGKEGKRVAGRVAKRSQALPSARRQPVDCHRQDVFSVCICSSSSSW